MYTAHTACTAYTAYTAYKAYTKYTAYTAYTIYRIYSIYTIYSIHSIYKHTQHMQRGVTLVLSYTSYTAYTIYTTYTTYTACHIACTLRCRCYPSIHPDQQATCPHDCSLRYPTYIFLYRTVRADRLPVLCGIDSSTPVHTQTNKQLQQATCPHGRSLRGTLCAVPQVPYVRSRRATGNLFAHIVPNGTACRVREGNRF